MHCDDPLELDLEPDPDEATQPRSFPRLRLLSADPSFDAGDDAPTLEVILPDPRTAVAHEQMSFVAKVRRLKRFDAGDRAPVGHLIAALDDVVRALDALLACARLSNLLAPGAPLSEYVNGLYVFCGAAADAIDDSLAGSERDETLLATRLVGATDSYFDGLTYAVRLELTRQHDPSRELATALEHLFFAAAFFYAHIATRNWSQRFTARRFR